jgi:uncharacterized RmlC-like cupin family protein
MSSEDAMHRYVTWLGLPLALASGATAAAAGPVIDNERVTVWDVKLTSGASSAATPHEEDTVIMFLEGGTIRTVDGSGRATTAERKAGEAVFVPRGTDATDTLVSGGPAHEVVIALKDHKVQPIANTAGLPAAFPRPGSLKVLDNDRIVVWNYTWAKDVPTPMHFHDKDVVVAYRFDGALKSVTPDGASVVNRYKTGDIRFNKGNRAHYEELVDDRQSAVMMELK